MELIRHVVEKKKQVILLIPEISLPGRRSCDFINVSGTGFPCFTPECPQGSAMTSMNGQERAYRYYDRASFCPVFAPFERLGLIIIDEEHENAYQSELSPRYDARETAKERARINQASLILGSATPSLESYTKAVLGEYILLKLTRRAKAARHCLRRRS